ncbi:DNA-binding response regulator [Paenibacillus sp. 598K]|uniref:response regulator transcription factor n=1 Tax=Paenibacillus sp. 598K TaxID=1117987 RepID=UPI000FF931E2|nr:response regulator [Paenibacillus sp. 598K]GBF73483.1 DNA-binding response regulator [Paenibacillus sp. 598K]
MKILIVDDEPLILNGLVKIVREIAPAGAEVRPAGSVVQALAVMQEYMPDVTVTDLHMPERDGFELIEEARRLSLCERFIILTGYEYFDYVRKALRAGVIDYLMKPVDKTEMAALLSSIHESLPSEADSCYTVHAKRILMYMEAHYAEDLSLERLAELMDLHPHYISRLFKKETGDNFVNYLNALRIREAQQLLKSQRQLPVSAVGQRVGFEDKHYFSKVFKKYTGRTPKGYRDEEHAPLIHPGKAKPQEG